MCSKKFNISKYRLRQEKITVHLEPNAIIWT